MHDVLTFNLLNFTDIGSISILASLSSSRSKFREDTNSSHGGSTGGGNWGFPIVWATGGVVTDPGLGPTGGAVTDPGLGPTGGGFWNLGEQGLLLRLGKRISPGGG